MPDNTQTIPCGGWYIDTTMFQFQDKVLKVIGDIDGAYLPLTGGTMGAGATIEGTDELQVSVADTGVSGTIGVTPESVTLVHNTNSTPDASVRLTADTVAIEAEKTNIQINGTGANFNGANLTGVGSIVGQNAMEVAIETTLDMNNHNIINVNDPQNPQDVATKNYVDTNKPTNATTAVAGLVKQSANVVEIATPSTATAEAVAETLNDLIQQLIAAGIMAAQS